MAASKDVSPLQLLLHQRNLDKDVTQVCSILASPHFYLHVRLDWHWFIRYFLQNHQCKEFFNTAQNSFSQTTMCVQLILLLLKLGFSGLVKFRDIHWYHGIQHTKPSECLPWWISLSLSCRSRRSDSCNSSWSCLFCSLYLSLGLESMVKIWACCPPVTTLDCLANLLGLNFAFPI